MAARFESRGPGPMCSRVAVAVLVSGALAACTPSRESPPESLYELGDRLARTICAGAPAEIEPVPNVHVDGQTDRLETRRCPAGSSTLYIGRSTSDPAGLAVAVEIRAPGAGLPPQLEIDQPIERAVRWLGVPQEQADGSATYGLGEGIDTVTIRHMSGRITSVQWTWLVD